MVRRSAVSLAAIADAKDCDGLPVVMKTDAVVAHAQAELRRIDVLEAFDVARASHGEALDGVLKLGGRCPYRDRPYLRSRFPLL